MRNGGMMRLIRDGRKADGPRVVVLGMFDGVHEGHRELIRAAREEAAELGLPLQVCTFEPHPLWVIRPETAPRLLNTLSEKASAMRKLGVDELRVIHFTRRLADTEPEIFLDALMAQCMPAAVHVGWNYTFGRSGRGNAAMLEHAAGRCGFRVRVHDPVRTAEGVVISSSEIRQRLLEGKTAEAARMLGEAYPISGEVIPGKHLGRTLGFPTANLKVPALKLLPDFGVYLCRLYESGTVYHGLVNIGNQPTLPSGHVTVEAHVLDGDPNLYGRYIRLRLLKRMRQERRFESREALIRQLEKDREDALRFFGMA